VLLHLMLAQANYKCYLPTVCCLSSLPSCAACLCFFFIYL
jgi:hypothetical protein